MRKTVRARARDREIAYLGVELSCIIFLAKGRLVVVVTTSAVKHLLRSEQRLAPNRSTQVSNVTECFFRCSRLPGLRQVSAPESNPKCASASCSVCVCARVCVRACARTRVCVPEVAAL
jgi:hypothetical protein